jgi:hypothetical protein
MPDSIPVGVLVIHAISEEARKFYIALGFSVAPHARMLQGCWGRAFCAGPTDTSPALLFTPSTVNTTG